MKKCRTCGTYTADPTHTSCPECGCKLEGVYLPPLEKSTRELPNHKAFVSPRLKPLWSYKNMKWERHEC